MTAEQVVAELAEAVPEAEPSVVYNAETDPNDLLGRPNGYTSKASFTDTRIPPEETHGFDEGAVEFGGSVEVFSDEEGARRRMEYIQAIAEGAPVLGEYDYVAGPVLVRVSLALTPDQAAEYEAALAGIDP